MSVCLLCFSGGRELHSDCLALVQAPTVQVESQLTLPLDINNFPISKFIQLHFRVSCAFRSIPTITLQALQQHLGQCSHFYCTIFFGNRFHFALQESKFGMLTAPLKTPLTHLDDDLTHEALDAFVMVAMSCVLPYTVVCIMSTF